MLDYDLGDVLTEIGMIGNPGMGRDRRDAALCVLDHIDEAGRDRRACRAKRVAGPAALFTEEDEAIWRDEDRVSDSRNRFQ